MSEMSSIDGTAKVGMERNAAYTSQHVPAPPPYCSPPLQFGTRPINCKCPHCHQQVVTNMQVQAGLFAWLIFSLFIIFGCWCGCCLIPFYRDDCKDCLHYCPNCGAFMGQFKHI